jgi:hypothetical protein
MAYYITSAGFEIDYTQFQDASLTFYLYKFGLGHYITLFISEEIDLYCITIMNTRHMNEIGMNETEKKYFMELQEVYCDLITYL